MIHSARIIHRSAAILLVLSTILFASCDSDDDNKPAAPTTIMVTDAEHHLGDNPGTEGPSYEGSFSVSGPFAEARLSITFLYPNAAEVSGPEIDSPPEIRINDVVIGLTPSDFPETAECISSWREYECDVTIRIDATNSVVLGDNTVTVSAGGAAHAGDDDFVFTDLSILLYRN